MQHSPAPPGDGGAEGVDTAHSEQNAGSSSKTSSSSSSSSSSSNSSRQTSSTGLRPRAAFPQNAKEASRASSRELPTYVDVAAFPCYPAQEHQQQQKQQQKQQQQQEPLEENSCSVRAPLDRGESAGWSSRVCLATASSSSSASLVSASLRARAAELCQQPEVHAQLFLMLRSSQGQLAAMCMSQLPPQSYIALRDETGHTLLHWAALCNERSVMKLLIDAGADVNARATETKQTPLMWAVTKDNTAAARLLLQHGAALFDYQLSNSEAKGSLEGPLQPQGLPDYCPERLGQSPLLQDSKGGTCCTLAAQHDAPKCVLLLAKLLGPAAFAVPDASGSTPAHWAAFKGHTLVLRLLLYFDVDVTAVDLFGCLPLHRAAEGGHLEAFRALVEEGGQDPSERTTKSRLTPLDIIAASKTVNPELTAYVKKLQQNPQLRNDPRNRVLTEDDMRVRWD
ncbi:Ankyrin repeat protein, related [Eimeria necatrix]|uniref:Ankyrin repeat protein, related n=1 Tax=Eimeria necatrix TaxID=51315 RepID=U6MH19_9EIME|nr:Ankyrin repeat protein, related [Eimeria necatrix]CDJ63326.1 Ankyrin repeat protein, related [Eimeria necatrix]